MWYFAYLRSADLREGWDSAKAKNSTKTQSSSPIPAIPVVGDLDEPYSAESAQRSSHTDPPGYIGWMGTVAANVDRRAPERGQPTIRFV